MTVDTLQLSQEFVAGPARIRFDVLGTEPVDSALADKDFLDYRLADVRIETEPTLDAPDIVWERDAEKSIEYDGRWMTFRGDWASGPIQKVVVTMLALRLEEKGLHPFHASAVRYRDKTVLFLGGESNHGKSMGQIEACRRGALLVSTETTVVGVQEAETTRNQWMTGDMDVVIATTTTTTTTCGRVTGVQTRRRRNGTWNAGCSRISASFYWNLGRDSHF